MNVSIRANHSAIFDKYGIFLDNYLIDTCDSEEEARERVGKLFTNRTVYSEVILVEAL